MREREVDVVVVGAGFAGLYLLYRLRQLGLSVRAFETGDDVGGTWYWNRYPGARCDIQSVDYSFSFDPELDAEWTWSEKFATQPEILGYLQHVADRHDLRRDIEFSTRVDAAQWDEDSRRWHVRTEGGEEVTARFYVMASGCLSMPKVPDVPGAERFRGDVYFTNRWPHEGVDLTGKRVAVIGTGSSGIQSIPLIAKQASELTVFQRTPNFSMPALNGPVPAEKLAAFTADRAAYRQAQRMSLGGVPREPSTISAFAVSEEERQAAFEAAWAEGDLFALGGTFMDVMANESANALVCEFIREKIRSIVKDPATAEMLCPKDHPFGTKRPCLDSNYYATYNLPHVRLVDLKATPIVSVTETGIDTSSESFEFDVIVYATGFDAMTGAVVAVDIKGRDGLALKDKWSHGPKTYLGVTVAGFPNFFTITGPGSPSVLSNMVVSIEQHVDWICDVMDRMRTDGFDAIEATEVAESAWVQHVNDFGDLTLYPKANSWYMGANVPGKPRVFLPYVGGVVTYRMICDQVAEKDYLGFRLDADTESRVNEGIIRPLRPDVQIVLDMMAMMGVPPLESLSVDDARAVSVAGNAAVPPGPEVGEVEDGTLPGAAGELRYRLYRPATDGPHAVIAYFHGGGWVLGSHESDDPFCRDLCVRSNAVVISVDYRHAPEARFPAAAEDGFAAVTWIAEYAGELGGIPGQLSVAGWSAGANVATVASHLARDAGGPAISAQLLVNPVVDADMGRASYVENAEGYLLTAGLMKWFWDHYTDEPQRSDPLASPLRADNLGDLPPAVVVTSEFDPLRDEGVAYAEALEKSGTTVRHIAARGHIHTSLTAVGVVPSGAEYRAEMVEALQEISSPS